jgi:fatty-acyl-CoA synthase
VLHSLGVGLALAAFGDPFSFRQDDVYMPLTPMFHVHAWGMPFIATLLGVKQIYPGRYEPERLVRMLVEHRVTVTHGVPTILHMILTQATKDGVRFDGLKMLVGGSALSRGLCERALERGIHVTTGYGMSETCPILSVSRVKPALAGSGPAERVGLFTATGFPVPLVEARINDEDGAALPGGADQVGELVVRAPWLTTGYTRNVEASQTLWRDGWLHTGDVAYRDEEGYLHITDRLKDVIKSGGEWVSSLALENLFSQHAAVSEVAVVGTKDERWGERPVAFVVLRPGQTEVAARAALREHVMGFVNAGTLQRWAVPEDVRFVPELPKTSVGKLNKRTLRALLVSP